MLRTSVTHTSTSVFEGTLKLQLLKHPMRPLFIEGSTIATKWGKITLKKTTP